MIPQLVITTVLLGPPPPPEESPGRFRDFLGFFEDRLEHDPPTPWKQLKGSLTKLRSRFPRAVAASPPAQALQLRAGCEIARQLEKSNQRVSADARLDVTFQHDYLVKTRAQIESELPRECMDRSIVTRLGPALDRIANAEIGQFTINCSTDCIVYIEQRAEASMRPDFAKTCNSESNSKCAYAGSHEFMLPEGQYWVFIAHPNKRQAPYSKHLTVQPQRPQTWNYPRVKVPRAHRRAMERASHEYRLRLRGEGPSPNAGKLTKIYYVLGLVLNEFVDLAESLKWSAGDSSGDSDDVPALEDVAWECAAGTIASGSFGIIAEALANDKYDDPLEALWMATIKPEKLRGGQKALVTLLGSLTSAGVSAVAADSEMDPYGIATSVMSGFITWHMPFPVNWGADWGWCVGTTYAKPYVMDWLADWL
jgi:hypothetical protein